VYRLGTEEEEDETYFPWFRAMGKTADKLSKKLFLLDEEEVEERNDICIYKTLRYPPKSTPPTAN
jgi:hypothetical protein